MKPDDKDDVDSLVPVEDNALERELRSRQKRHGHPSSSEHAVNPLGAVEYKRVISRKVNGKGAKDKRMKKYDGRSLRNYRPRIDKAMKTFYDEVNMPEFKAALEYSNDPKFQMLMFALGNPRLQSCSFAELCRRCQLSITDVTALWRNHQIQRGMLRMMNHMPQVMEDTAEDAKAHTHKCARCDGTGKLEGETINKRINPVCPECHGDGKIRVVGDKDARQLVFESAGLKKAPQGPQFNLTIGSGPSFDETIASAENALDAIDITPGGQNGSDNGGKVEVEEAPAAAGPDRADSAHASGDADTPRAAEAGPISEP